MTRRQFTVGALAAPLVNAQGRRPNIVWIMADDLGLCELGCYGQKYIKTPNIDKLAAEGTAFDEAYAGCAVCAPSRSVLMTGLHGGHTPIRSNPGGVPILPGETTVADLLQRSGYRTGLFGKWGLGDIGTEGVPWKHGFDEFYGFLHQAHAHFQYPRFLYDNDKQSPLEGNSDTSKKTYANDAMADRAVDFIRRHKDRPFFLYYSPTIPHFEPLVPEDSMAEYRGKFPMGKPYGREGQRLAAQPDLRTAYAGMVSRVDRYVGSIMAELAKHGLDRDTVVFFTSDNGGVLGPTDDFFSSMGKYRGNKGTMYEGGLRVPMIARWTGRIAAGKRSNYPWYFADFLPTACELAGVKNLPAKIDGHSVVPTLLGKGQKQHEVMYWEMPRYNGKTQEFADEIPMQALRNGRWKALRPKANAPVEIYNLEADPSESNNLAETNTDEAKRLTKLLADSRTPPRRQKEPPHPWWDARS
jgi:arylsulfatase A